MKNLKIYKGAIALLMASSIVLLSGCTTSESNKTNKESTSQTQRVNTSCDHLTIYFAEGPVTFKECEGYEIFARTDYGSFYYTIKKGGKYVIQSGWASDYTSTTVNHAVEDEHLNIESLQKTK